MSCYEVWKHKCLNLLGCVAAIGWPSASHCTMHRVPIRKDLAFVPLPTPMLHLPHTSDQPDVVHQY